jgi:H+/Cl- antiporter ClcA
MAPLAEILKMVSIVLYSLIGVISLIMAFKTLSSRKFLPFHEEAYGKPWEDVDEKLRPVFIALLRISGLGFLAVALLMLTFPVVDYIQPNAYLKYAIPSVALIFCSGLFLINFILFKKTKAKTPWKNSLYAMIAILLSMLISII